MFIKFLALQLCRVQLCELRTSRNSKEIPPPSAPHPNGEERCPLVLLCGMWIAPRLGLKGVGSGLIGV